MGTEWPHVPNRALAKARGNLRCYATTTRCCLAWNVTAALAVCALQDEDSQAPAPPQGIARALFKQHQQHEGPPPAQWLQAVQTGQAQQKQGQGQRGETEMEQPLGQRVGAAAAQALERTRHIFLLMQVIVWYILGTPWHTAVHKPSFRICGLFVLRLRRRACWL